MMHGYNWFGHGMYPMGFGFFGLWQWLIIIGIVLILVAVFRSRRKGSLGGEEDALEIIRRMYAKGEISEEEYLNRKKVLERK